LVSRAHWKGFQKPCKSEGKEKDDAPADFALIGAAQRVEHYEIAAYTTARNLALHGDRSASHNVSWLRAECGSAAGPSGATVDVRREDASERGIRV
jgi:Domain of unknown function (DUF892)